MANVMSFKNIKNKPHRSAFDLSYKNSFTAKVGELLPCFVKEVLPGDKFHINPSHFTRTAPVNTAAYTRIRENVDFFFVPYRLLWDKWTQFIAMTDDPHYASSFTSAAGSFTSTPFFTDKTLSSFMSAIATLDGTHTGNTLAQDACGFPMSMTSPKLLQYLGYGAFIYPFSVEGSSKPDSGLAISPFRAAAYQKIYYDYFRNSQWESSKPQCYNFDYIFSNSSLELPVNNFQGLTPGVPYDHLFVMRYANYSKDLTNGLNPSPQFGDTAVAGPVLGNLAFSARSRATGGSHLNVAASAGVGYVGNDGNSTFNGYLPLISSSNTSGISVLAIRLAESLQKYREITLTGSKDYKDQIEKHWGVKVPDYASDLCQRVYSYDSMIEISEVVNSNVSNADADIRGKGISSASGGFTWSNDSNDYGVLMGIYHAEPLLDYQSDLFIDRNVVNCLPSSFPVPELDSVGMEGVPRLCVSTPTSFGNFGYNNTVGYAPRYFEYKTSRDIIQGGFGSYGKVNYPDSTFVPVAEFNGGYNTWVSAYGKNFDYQFQEVSYLTFKISSFLLNPIFTSQVTHVPVYLDGPVTYPDYSSDQLLIKSFFDCKVVRNLSFDGLPY